MLQLAYSLLPSYSFTRPRSENRKKQTNKKKLNHGTDGDWSSASVDVVLTSSDRRSGLELRLQLLLLSVIVLTFSRENGPPADPVGGCRGPAHHLGAPNTAPRPLTFTGETLEKKKARNVFFLNSTTKTKNGTEDWTSFPSDLFLSFFICFMFWLLKLLIPCWLMSDLMGETIFYHDKGLDRCRIVISYCYYRLVTMVFFSVTDCNERRFLGERWPRRQIKETA